MRIHVPIIPLVITIERRPWRPFRWRLSLGGLLVLVGIVAVVLVPLADSRKTYCRQQILVHSVEEMVYRRRILKYEKNIEEARGANSVPDPRHIQSILDYKPLALYHRGQIGRYQRAVWFPWVSLTPDPRSPISQAELFDPAWGRRYAEEFQRIQRFKQAK